MTTKTVQKDQPAKKQGVPRIESLDVLRGVAIIGTLASNVWIWAHAFTDKFTGATGAYPYDWSQFWSNLPNGKFLSLLTIMFGIGIGIQYDSAKRRGNPWPGYYPWRALMLFLLGIAHYVFVFEFDVLMGYAVTSFIVSYLLLTKVRTQWIVAGFFAVYHLIFFGASSFVNGVRLPSISSLGTWFLGLFGITDGGHAMLGKLIGNQSTGLDITQLSDSALKKIAESAATQNAIDTTKNLDVSTFQTYDFTYWTEVASRFTSLISSRLQIMSIFPMTIATFMSGALLYRAGIFEERGKRLRLWLMIIGLGVFGTLDFAISLASALMVTPEQSSWLLSLFNGNLFTLKRYIFSLGTAYGILALIIEVVDWRKRHNLRPTFIGKRFNEVGKTALTCYVGHNALGMLFAAQWGWDAASWSPFTGLYHVLFIFSILALSNMIFAWAWLKFFKRGPLEWVLWKSYTLCTQGSDWLRRQVQRPIAPATA